MLSCYWNPTSIKSFAELRTVWLSIILRLWELEMVCPMAANKIPAWISCHVSSYAHGCLISDRCCSLCHTVLLMNHGIILLSTRTEYCFTCFSWWKKHKTQQWHYKMVIYSSQSQAPSSPIISNDKWCSSGSVIYHWPLKKRGESLD